ncbi:MAG: Rieske (2Fe-2S) protein [Thermoguttaceae bacterium]|nr:Rieske (2Fe-2S) protein [Thermoguttaceae bacterium]MDW8078987.1 Rieske (2Fe-2S) protein [Thermoguttaceae bacterium]
MTASQERLAGCCSGGAETQESPTSCGPGSTLVERRGLFGFLIGWGAAILAYLAPIGAALRAFLAAAGSGQAQGGQFRRVALLDQLPADGSPISFPILADRVDGWTRFPVQAIGAVFLRRGSDGSIQAINVRCPHAGCSIVYDKSNQKLFCPCHEASFDLDGRRLDANSPSPRDLDTLPAEVRNGNEIWVQFTHFRTGTPEKVPE